MICKKSLIIGLVFGAMVSLLLALFDVPPFLGMLQ